MAYRQADWNSGIADTKMGTQSNVGWPNPAGTAFPNAVYTEVTQRITAATQNSSCPSNQPTCIITGYWTFPADESQDPFNEIMSFVFIEMYGDPPENGGGSGNEGQGCCYSNPTEPGSVSGYDPTVYHDYGSRVTVASDGSGNYGYCFYLDQKQLGCSALGGMPNPSTWLNGRNSYILEVGPQATSTTSCNGTCEPQQTQVYLVQSVRIWTCSNWQSSQCNSSVDTGSP